MKYTVYVKEVSTGRVSVNAQSSEEAREKAEEKFYNGEVYWKDTDFEVVLAKEERERGDAR